MPQFNLDVGNSTSFGKLDAFTQGYIEAMFFTNTGDGDDAENGLDQASVDELSREAFADIVADCKKFKAEASVLLKRAYRRDYTAEQAGRDFWFTRNGHGVGFWDRDALERGELGKLLSNLCGWRTAFGEKYIYRGDDGQIHYCA
jgi:hypothetical protein